MDISKKTSANLYISWSILVLFFLYQYVVRNAFGVLIEEIRHQYRINADQFALMGSMYYYGYSLIQIPLGLMIDRVGVRNTVIVSIILCVFGTIILALSDQPFIGYLSRLIIGIGTASAFMSSLKFASDYLPSNQQGYLIGATLTFGAFGALITGTPLNHLLALYNWQTSFIIIACVGIILLAMVLLYVHRSHKTASSKKFNYSYIFENIKNIAGNRKILLYAFIAIGLYAPLSVMADLWGTAFIVKKFNITREVASPILMSIYIGMAIGSVILPYFATKYNILDEIIKTSSLSLLILFIILIYTPNISQNSLVILLVTIGFCCGAEMLCFTAVLKYSNPSISGLTIGVVNTLNMLSGALMQQSIGYYLDLTWKNELDNTGLRVYSVKEFIEAFTILVIVIGICTIFAMLFLRKKKKALSDG